MDTHTRSSIAKFLIQSGYLDQFIEQALQNLRDAVLLANDSDLVARRREFVGAEQGLFEIAIIDSQDQRLAHLWDEEDGEDTVCGYCSVEKVHHYIRKISQL